MSELALARIAECKRTRSPWLDLGNCGLEGYIPEKVQELEWLERINLGTGRLDKSGEFERQRDNIGPANHLFDATLMQISTLNRLKQLYANVCGLESMNGVAGLSSLEILSLSSNQISQISGLETLIGLQSLDLNSNQISQINGLETLIGLQTLYLNGNEISQINGLETLIGLQTLYLNGNEISQISGLKTLIGLQSLDLNSNQISQISGLETLISLQRLSLNSNQISQISGLETLIALRKLNLNSNQISQISGLETLIGLQSLYLNSNQISQISGLETLIALQSLYLNSNQISQISGVETLEGLQTLNLHSNQISQINGLETLIGLQTLDLNSNQISQISGLETLIGLQSLNLNNNQISQIGGLETLIALQSLNLNSNQISQIGGLETLIALQSLSLNSNQISHISGLETLIALQKLNLNSNQISQISGLETLEGLQTLYLNSNQISQISGLETLTGLQSLDLDSNQISQISGLETLIALQSLDLNSNQISQISGLETLIALQSLDLNSNQISQINGLETLIGLQSLYLDSNQISQISGLETLIGLQYLYLNSNQISQISGLETLIGLQSFSLESNQISQISGLETLIELQYLYLKDNPIQNIPTEIAFSRDAQHIFQYLASIADPQKRASFNEVKLILIGNTRVGKSNLADFLVQGESYRFSDDHYTTPGIRVWRWWLGPGHTLYDRCIQPANLDDLAINIWDFGGQDFYHGTHHLFFRQGAVYLLLWEHHKTATTQSDQAEETICFPEDYWLDNIRHHAPDSVVITVQNKMERDGRANLPEAWQKEYNLQQEESYSLSLKKSVEQPQSEYGDKWEDFTRYLSRRLCAIPAKEQIQINSDWLVLRNHILALQGEAPLPMDNPFADYFKQPYLTLDEFQKCCAEVVPDFIQFANTFLKLFDARGVLIHFAGHPTLGKLVFLHPGWITGKIYKLLHKELRERAEPGIFDRAYAKSCFGDDAAVLLDLMQQFELIYADPLRPDYFVAVQYLAPLDPDHDEAAYGFTAHQTAPSLELRLPLFHQQRILRQLIARLGSDPTLEKRLLRRDCIILSTRDKTFLRLEGKPEDSSGVLRFYTDRPEQLDWVIQLWLEVLMQYLSSFGWFDISPIWRDGGKIDSSFAHYRRQIRAFFNSETEVETFIKAVEEVMRPHRYLGSDSMIDTPVRPLLMPSKGYVARIWGSLFSEKLTRATVNWETTDELSSPNKEQLRSSEKQFHYYAENLALKTPGTPWVKFSTLLDYAQTQTSAQLPTANGASVTEAHSFSPYLKSLGFTMENQPKQIFISYAHADKEWKDKFRTATAMLTKHLKTAVTWNDQEILAGADWKAEIIKALSKADIVVCLLSPDFINSDFIFEEEIRRSYDLDKRLIPVYVRRIPLLNELPLGAKQGTPMDDQGRWKPIKQWEDQDEAWARVVEDIQKVINALN